MHVFCCGCSCAYVCIVSYAAGHRKECVTEMVRVQSADSPCQLWLGSKLLPKVQVYVRSRSSMSSHVIMFLLLSCRVEGESRVSRTRTRQVPLKEGVCIFCCGCSCVFIVVLYAARHQKEGTKRSACVTEVVRCQPQLWSKLLPEVQVYMCVRSYQVKSSCFCCFLVEDGSTVSFTQNSS